MPGTRWLAPQQIGLSALSAVGGRIPHCGQPLSLEGVSHMGSGSVVSGVVGQQICCYGSVSARRGVAVCRDAQRVVAVGQRSRERSLQMQVANDVASAKELPSCEARPGRRVNNSAAGKLLLRHAQVTDLAVNTAASGNNAAAIQFLDDRQSQQRTAPAIAPLTGPDGRTGGQRSPAGPRGAGLQACEPRRLHLGAAGLRRTPAP